MQCCFECHGSMVVSFGLTHCTHAGPPGSGGAGSNGQRRAAFGAGGAPDHNTHKHLLSCQHCLLSVEGRGERHLGLEAPQIVLPTRTSSSASIAF